MPIIVFVFCTHHAISQDLKKMEDDLRNTYVDINDYKKMRQTADKLYKLDPYNETATYYLTTTFSHAGLQDSINSLFASLKAINSTNPEPYLLSAKYQYKELSLEDTMKLNELLMAARLDSSNFETFFLLGDAYYTLFNSSPSMYYGYKAKQYLEEAVLRKKSSICYIKYPLLQVSSYLRDSEKVKYYSVVDYLIRTDTNNIPSEDIWYYPYDYVLTLDSGWMKDYTVNVMNEIGHASFVMHWYSSNLFAMKEPLVYNQKGKTIYRLTWLRSFHLPVAIRLEITSDIYTLHWKMADRIKGTYDPDKLIFSGSRKLTNEQYNTFNKLLKDLDFWNLPIKINNMGTDGAQWIMEGLSGEKYHVVDRWSPRNDSYEKLGKYMIGLTDLKISKGDMY